MKLNYKILWLDDQIDEFVDDEYVTDIEQHLIEEGFKPEIRTLSSPKELEANLSEDWDLILTDYNMAGKNGDDVIKEIRSKAIYTEILFYTAQSEWTKLSNIDRISFLQTSSTGLPHQESVKRSVLRLIDLTIKKFQNIIAMRGMIMHETSSLDAQLDSILDKYLSCNEEGCRKCELKLECSPIADCVLDKMEHHLSKKLEIVGKRNFKNVRKDNFLYSADFKRIVLGLLLDKNGIDDFSDGYKNDIIKVRNIFAHAVLVTENGRQYFKNKKEGIDFDSEFCKKIRKDIIYYKGLIDNAEQVLLQNAKKEY